MIEPSFPTSTRSDSSVVASAAELAGGAKMPVVSLVLRTKELASGRNKKKPARCWRHGDKPQCYTETTIRRGKNESHINTTQRSMPAGVDESNRKHHRTVSPFRGNA
jgi:hypothetical protein